LFGIATTFCVVDAASSIKGGARHWNDASPMPLTTLAINRAWYVCEPRSISGLEWLVGSKPVTFLVLRRRVMGMERQHPKP
jgi:hypothetical protein